MKIKRIVMVAFALFLCLLNIDKVFAFDDAYYGVYCEYYGSLYFKYYSDSVNSEFKIDTNFDELLSINIEKDRPKKLISDSKEIAWLESKGLLTTLSNGKKMFDCPSNPFGTTLANNNLKDFGRGYVINDFPVVTTVFAEYSSDLHDNGVYCAYGVDKMDGTGNVITDQNGNKKVFYSFGYYGGNLDSTYEFDGGYEGLQKLHIFIENGRPGKMLNDKDELDWLAENDMLISNGTELRDKSWSCPSILDDPNDLDGDGYTWYTLVDYKCKTSYGTVGSTCIIANTKSSDSDAGSDLIIGGSSTGDSDDCGSILGQEMIDFINKIFRWIQIIAPIIVIVMGGVEFAGAVLQDDKDALKKASSKFIKRLIIAVALFFIPIILSFLLEIFNDINGSNASTCGIGV